MDKGIFNLICTVVILFAIGGVGFKLNQTMKAVNESCQSTKITMMVTPTPTLVPTVAPATPSASVKRVVTVVPTVKAVK